MSSSVMRRLEPRPPPHQLLLVPVTRLTQIPLTPVTSGTSIRLTPSPRLTLQRVDRGRPMERVSRVEVCERAERDYAGSDSHSSTASPQIPMQRLQISTHPRILLKNNQRSGGRQQLLPACAPSTSRQSLPASSLSALKRKIEQRPTKHALVHQHILLTATSVDPLIQEKARELRRCGIANRLARKLRKRPGPLELVTRKILKADAELEQAIQDGRVLFQPTGREDDYDERIPVNPFAADDMEVIGSNPDLPSLSAQSPDRNKTKMRKKSTPYRTELQSRVTKTKAPDCKDETADEAHPPVNPAQTDTANSSYALLLQQQQLFLEWQMEMDEKGQEQQQQELQRQSDSATPPALTRSEDADEDGVIFERMVAPQREPMPAGIAPENGPRSRLVDFRVQDLKNECKKRNLPVSGPKPQLLERLKPFERVILESAAAAAPSSPLSPPSSEASVPSNGYKTDECSPPVLQSPSVQPQMVIQVAPPQQQLVQLVDAAGNVVGMATVVQPMQQVMQQMPGQIVQQQQQQCLPPPPPPPPQQQQRIMQQPPPPPPSQQAQCSCAHPPTTSSFPVTQPADNTFRFSQHGSGGQFTLTPCDHRIPNEDVREVVMLAPQMEREEAPLLQQQTRMDDARYEQQPHTQSPLSGQEPPDASPALPAQTFQHEGHTIHVDPNDPGSLLSAATLSMHEDMIRYQQKKIDEMQAELAKSQKQLRHQQQVILAAKKAQQQHKKRLAQPAAAPTAPRQPVKEALQRVDVKALNKTQMQLLLQHKMQQQTMQAQVAEQQQLAAAEAKLQDELHIEQAVQDIVRLIKQDARTALLIVQLLRRYQLERSQNVDEPKDGQQSQPSQDMPLQSQQLSHMVPVQQVVHMVQRPVIEMQPGVQLVQQADGQQVLVEMLPPPPMQMVVDQGVVYQTPIDDYNQPTPPMLMSQADEQQAPKKDGAVDMEEIFKTVLKDASRAITGEESSDAAYSPLETANVAVDITQNRPSVASVTTHMVQPQHPMTPLRHEVHMQGMETPPKQQQQQRFFHHHQQQHNEFDDIMDVLRDDQDASKQSSSSSLDFGIGYGSEELATLLGDNWLDAATESIAASHTTFDGMSQSCAAQSMQDGSQQMQCDDNMDWLDMMLQSHSQPVDHSAAFSSVHS